MIPPVRALAPLLLLGLVVSGEDPKPVDVGRILRESPEFKAQCGKYRITFADGHVTAVGAIVYRGGGPCEYAVGVYPSKPHETMILLDDGPFTGPGRRPQEYVKGLATNLNNAMLAAGFPTGRPFDWDRETGEVFPPKGETVHLYAEWTDAAKKVRRARISDWLWNYKRIEVMEEGRFVYTGSVIYDEGEPDHKKWLGAEMDGLIVAVLNTSTAMIDCVEEGASENGVYEAIPIRMPEAGTRVTVHFSRTPMEVTEVYPPLELPKELQEEKKRRAEEKAKGAEKPKEEERPSGEGK
jgi:hypothetical protein